MEPRRQAASDKKPLPEVRLKRLLPLPATGPDCAAPVSIGCFMGGKGVFFAGGKRFLECLLRQIKEPDVTANWCSFITAWNAAGLRSHSSSALGRPWFHSRSILALLTAQQEVGARVKGMKLHTPCRQFMADMDASEWFDDAVLIRLGDNELGSTFEYLAGDRRCFKGHLQGAWELPSPPRISAARHQIPRSVAEFKLNQFKELFPELTHMWVFVNAVTIAHFLQFTHSQVEDAAQVEHVLKHCKVHFDADAICRAYDAGSGLPDLDYSIHRLSVGRYAVHTLCVAAAQVNLMQISLGIYQRESLAPSPAANAVDILVD